MKKLITLFLFCMILGSVYCQSDCKSKNLYNLEIIGSHEDFDTIIDVGNSIIMALVENDYELLSDFCCNEVRFSQELGFSLEKDTVINKISILEAGSSNQKYLFYRYQPDKYFLYSLKDVLYNYSPILERLNTVKINGLIKNCDAEERFLEIINEIFGDCVSLEYYTKATDLQLDWECTILVLKKEGSTYKLSGLSRDHWEP